MKNSLLILFIILFGLNSCSTSKDIIYLQDIENNQDFTLDSFDYQIKKGDILKISISEKNDAKKLFDPTSSSLSQTTNRESLIFDGYTVSANGMIEYPELGLIEVSGITVDQLELLISKKYTENKILLNPTINVKVLNWNFTILGEVNNPGKYFFDENYLNILQAIGIAGDLTINGKRDDIKLIRKINATSTVYNIDLTRSDFLNSNVFQVYPGDIIIINPNSSRVKNAGIIGNSGTLLSLLSFLLSSIIVITNN